MANTNLGVARGTRNDEFYTKLSDIRDELENYSDKFRGKIVFCNCDDPFRSNFVKYFLMNFNRLGLKELLVSGFKALSAQGVREQACGLRITGTEPYLRDGQQDLDAAGVDAFLQNYAPGLVQELKGNLAASRRGLFYAAGDFRSDMSIEMLEQCDVVVTNPPFSLFREHVAQLTQYEKQFLVIGSLNAVTYIEFFPFLTSGQVWAGCRNGSKTFLAPDGSERKMGNVWWFTNLDHACRHIMLPVDLNIKYHGHEDMYPVYDNFAVINVDKTVRIPCDYTGVMGVPISFLDKYCPEQFEIVGITVRNQSLEYVTRIYTEQDYPDFNDRNGSPLLIINGQPRHVYHRLLIRYVDAYVAAHPEQFGAG